jgi:hypothetical protein
MPTSKQIFEQRWKVVKEMRMEGAEETAPTIRTVTTRWILSFKKSCAASGADD